MFNSSILDISIGMVLLYVLISLLCSAITEMISQFFRMRAVNLEEGLMNLLKSGEGNKLVSALYSHPLIIGLSKIGQKPSYIPPKNFILALMDIMSGNQGKLPMDNKSLLAAIEKQGSFANSEAGKSIILLLHEAGEDAVKARKNLEDWYNGAMDRVGGWYKQKTQYIIFLIALTVCVTLNIDSVKISQTLWTDIALRQAMVAAASSQSSYDFLSQKNTAEKILPNSASTVITASEPDSNVVTTENVRQSAEKALVLFKQIEELHLPVGWKDKEEKWVYENFSAMDWFIKFMGILISTFAASLGAPFWFQLLNKIVDLRSTGKQPDKSESN